MLENTKNNKVKLELAKILSVKCYADYGFQQIFTDKRIGSQKKFITAMLGKVINRVEKRISKAIIEMMIPFWGTLLYMCV